MTFDVSDAEAVRDVGEDGEDGDISEDGDVSEVRVADDLVDVAVVRFAVGVAGALCVPFRILPRASLRAGRVCAAVLVDVLPGAEAEMARGLAGQDNDRVAGDRADESVISACSCCVGWWNN